MKAAVNTSGKASTDYTKNPESRGGEDVRERLVSDGGRIEERNRISETAETRRQAAQDASGSLISLAS